MARPAAADEPDRYTHDAAAYVLGALSDVDREAFQRHLTGCQSCAGAVRDFTAIPGMLATVPAELASAALAGEAPQPSPTLLPSLLAAAR